MSVYIPLAIAVIALFAVAFGIVSIVKGKPTGETASLTVENIAGMCAFALAFASVLLSIHFPLSLAETFLMKFVLVTMFIAFVLIQYTAAFWLTAFWNNGNIGLVFAAIGMMVSTILISIIAGQAFMADVSAYREAELAKQSDSYIMAMQQRQAAMDKAASLAVSEGNVESARAAIEKAKADMEAFLNSTAKNKSGQSVGTVRETIKTYGCSGYYGKFCDSQREFKRIILENERIIRQHDEYAGAQSYADSLLSSDIPRNSSAKIAGFDALSNITGIGYELIRDYFWISLSVFTEISAQLSFIFLGWNRRRRGNAQGGIPAAAMPAYRHGGHVYADGPAVLHAGEYVMPPEAVQLYGRDKLEELRQVALGASAPTGGRPQADADKPPAAVLFGTGTRESAVSEPVPNRADGQGRKPAGAADAACVTAEIYAAYLSGELSPADGRDKVRTFLKTRGHAVSNNRLGECLDEARAKWKKMRK